MIYCSIAVALIAASFLTGVHRNSSDQHGRYHRAESDRCGAHGRPEEWPNDGPGFHDRPKNYDNTYDDSHDYFVGAE